MWNILAGCAAAADVASSTEQGKRRDTVTTVSVNANAHSGEIRSRRSEISRGQMANGSNLEAQKFVFPTIACCLMAIAYWITRSARAKTVGGMANPISLAAFRLMIKSNFVGCSTGKSAGFAPFKILST